nr:hypothetical protein BgiMline_027088 [Biomphalaria glabrata]
MVTVGKVNNWVTSKKPIMIVLVILAALFTFSQCRAVYDHDGEYKKLLFAIAGEYGDPKVYIVRDFQDERVWISAYRAWVYPVNTTVFPGMQTMYVREEIPPGLVKKSLWTFRKYIDRWFYKIDVTRYNFTRNVNPPDDPRGSTFFNNLAITSLVHNNFCDGMFGLIEWNATNWVGGLDLCELNSEEKEEYAIDISCSYFKIWGVTYPTGNYTDFILYKKKLIDFPPDWYVRSTPCQLISTG